MASQTTAKKRPRGRPFDGAADPRNRQNLAATRAVKPVPPLVPVAGTGLLAAIRHVLTNDRVHDATPIQKEVRAWLKQDRKGFMAKYADLEKAELAAAGRASGGSLRPGVDSVAPAPDPGTERCLRLAKQWLERRAAEHGKGSA